MHTRRPPQVIARDTGVIFIGLLWVLGSEYFCIGISLAFVEPVLHHSGNGMVFFTP